MLNWGVGDFLEHPNRILGADKVRRYPPWSKARNIELDCCIGHQHKRLLDNALWMTSLPVQSRQIFLSGTLLATDFPSRLISVKRNPEGLAISHPHVISS